MRNRGERLFKTAQIKKRRYAANHRYLGIGWWEAYEKYIRGPALKDEGKRLQYKDRSVCEWSYYLSNDMHSTRQREDAMRADALYYDEGVYEWIYEDCFD